MKQLFRNTTLLKGVVYLLLIGQLSSSTLTYCYWLIDRDADLIELSKVEDSESEEEDKKEEQKDEIRLDFHDTTSDYLIATYMTLHAKDCPSLHHPEVRTPPPKYLY